MEYILVIWLCLAVSGTDIPYNCDNVKREFRTLTDCRAEERAFRAGAIAAAYDPEEPVATFRIAPCVRVSEA